MAEDTIKLVSQQVLIVDIKTISSDEVTYKDPSMPDGPDFIIKKGEVASITFRNGVTQTYNPILETTNRAYEEENEKVTINCSSSNTGEENGYAYVSENGEIKMTYDFAKKRIYLHVDKPLMYNTKGVRNISITTCHFPDKELYLIFDMTNKVEGEALLSGWYAFVGNIDFHRYFKKNMPRTFEMDIPYETEHVSYKMKLSY